MVGPGGGGTPGAGFGSLAIMSLRRPKAQDINHLLTWVRISSHGACDGYVSGEHVSSRRRMMVFIHSQQNAAIIALV